jgi:uncharacterized membrane protein
MKVLNIFALICLLMELIFHLDRTYFGRFAYIHTLNLAVSTVTISTYR